jgi:hypothetical protein
LGGEKKEKKMEINLTLAFDGNKESTWSLFLFAKVALILGYLFPRKNYLIYKAECGCVCMYVPYRNPHLWTNLNQILHSTLF